MKKIKNFSLIIFSVLIFVCSAFVFTGCKDDDYSKLYVFSTMGGQVLVNGTDYVEFGDEGSRVFNFKENSTIKLKAIPNEGYSFVKWEYADDLDEEREALSTKSEINLFIGDDEIVVRAIFAVNGSAIYTITYPTNAEGYNIEVVNGYSTTVALGTDFKFKVNLLTNYSNSQITVKANNIILAPDANLIYTIPAINANMNITVEGVTNNVIPTTYNITASAVGARVMPVSSTGFVVNAGESFTFTLQLESGYKYSVAGAVVKANGVVIYGYDNYGVTYYTINNITQDIEIRVEGVETLIKYSVTLPIVGSNYKLTYANGANFASPTMQVDKDEYFSFRVNPNTGVNVKSITVLVNGSPIVPVSGYTYIIQVNTNLVISVTVAEETSTTTETYVFNLRFRDEVEEFLGDTTHNVPSIISFTVNEKNSSYQASSFMVTTSMDLGEITIVELINKINIYLVENSFDPMEYFELNGVKVIEFIDSIDAVIINWNLLTVAGEYTLTIVV